MAREMTREEAAMEIRKRHCTENKFCHDDCMYSENACPYGMAITALQEPERKWIPVSKRLPNREEYLKNDGRFILDDGNRRYQGLFDIYDGKFKFSKHISGISYELIEDNCVIAWQSLPEPYKEE